MKYDLKNLWPAFLEFDQEIHFLLNAEQAAFEAFDLEDTKWRPIANLNHHPLVRLMRADDIEPDEVVALLAQDAGLSSDLGREAQFVAQQRRVRAASALLEEQMKIPPFIHKFANGLHTSIDRDTESLYASFGCPPLRQSHLHGLVDVFVSQRTGWIVPLKKYSERGKLQVILPVLVRQIHSAIHTLPPVTPTVVQTTAPDTPPIVPAITIPPRPSDDDGLPTDEVQGTASRLVPATRLTRVRGKRRASALP